MELTHTVLLTGASILVTIGVTYGDNRARLQRIEKKVFNGEFVSKDEISVRVEKADEEHKQYDIDIRVLQEKVAKLEAKMEMD